MRRNRAQELGVGVLMVLAGVVVAGLAVKLGAKGLGDRVDVVAVFSDAAGLKKGAVVSVAGVEVGKVEGLEADFDTARVHLALDPEAQVRADVEVQIRARSLLGEKYIELVPQSREAPLLRDGDVLTKTKVPLEIDELVTALRPLVESDPSAFIKSLEQDPERVHRMVDDAEVLLHNARLASEQAPELVSEARRTMAEVRGATARVDALSARAESSLDRVDQQLDALPTERVDGLLGEAEATLAQAQAVLSELEGSTDELHQVLVNFSDIDLEALTRLLREEGIKVRLKAQEVPETPPSP